MTKKKENKQSNIAEPFNKDKSFDKSESVEESATPNYAKQLDGLGAFCEKISVDTSACVTPVSTCQVKLGRVELSCHPAGKARGEKRREKEGDEISAKSSAGEILATH